MIYLTGARKSIERERQAALRVLDNVTAQIPTDRIVSIYAAEAKVGTYFMNIVSGLLRLDSGRVARRLRRLSPLMNSGGVAGATQFGMMSLGEQIRWYARSGRISEPDLTAFVDKACDIKNEWSLPVYAVEWHKRRGIEAAAITSVPYDCYIIDRFELLEPIYRALVVKSCKIRGAGLIFSTDSGAELCDAPRQKYQLLDGRLDLLESM